MSSNKASSSSSQSNPKTQIFTSSSESNPKSQINLTTLSEKEQIDLFIQLAKDSTILNNLIYLPINNQGIIGVTNIMIIFYIYSSLEFIILRLF